jgi:hypothetical protein
MSKFACVVPHKLLSRMSSKTGQFVTPQAGLGIRIRRIRMFLGFPDTYPLVRGTDPDPSLKGVERTEIMLR